MRYRWRLLRAGRILLDGGGMFGVIPKVVWSRRVACDEQNRIELQHNCLLLESEGADPALGRVRRVLIEAGTGDKLDAKMSRIFGLDGRTVESAVQEAGVACEDIDDVIVSHLHFDHAGGLTRRVREGERPDWVAPEGAASGDCAEVCLTFPRARVHVQQREWDDALANDSVMTRTYYRDHLEPLRIPLADGSARVRTVASAPAFPAGEHIHHDQLPTLGAMERSDEVVPGIRVFGVPGHTWGQQCVVFDDVDGRRVCFVPDVMPTRHHVGRAYSLAYDVEAYTSMLSRHWLLRDAMVGGWHLVLDHEAGEAVFRVADDGRGWFRLEEGM